MSLTDQQLALRRSRIGSSEVAALLIDPDTGKSISPYTSPLRLFMEKTGRLEREPATDEQEWGSDVESAILAAHARKMGRQVWSPGTVLDIQHPRAAATPDGLLQPAGPGDGFINVEAKNVGRWARHHWKLDVETDEAAPLFYVAQTIWEQGVMRHSDLEDHAGFGPIAPMLDTDSHLVACIEGEPPRLYRIPYDPETYGYLLELADRFWVDHVEKDVAPEGWESEGETALDYCKRRWERSNGLLLPAKADQVVAWEELKRVKVEVSALKAAEKMLGARLRAAIGDADGLMGPDGKPIVTWKRTKDGAPRPVCDWEAACRALALLVQAKAPELVGEFQQTVNGCIATVSKAGHRTFLVKGIPKETKTTQDEE
jgi:predicted phage-related endonuclease